MVALGRKDGLPIGIHPLVSVLARPVKHVRLVTALLKAAALMQHKAQHVPLHGAARKCAPRCLLQSNASCAPLSPEMMPWCALQQYKQHAMLQHGATVQIAFLA